MRTSHLITIAELAQQLGTDVGTLQLLERSAPPAGLQFSFTLSHGVCCHWRDVER
jgi:hypothetical protein